MFKIGDIVQVKSGGPAMSVLTEGDQVECLWFAEGAEAFHRENFPAVCLEPIEFEEEGDKNEEDDED
jgi:uncharacterized protein YodC (DUF2158 family)